MFKEGHLEQATKVFSRYRTEMQSLKRRWRPVLRYHLMADALYWEDEVLPIAELESWMRGVLRHRTLVILGREAESRYFPLWIKAKDVFPAWIGFRPSRSSKRYAPKYEELKRTVGMEY